MKRDTVQHYAFLFLSSVMGLVAGGALVYSASHPRTAVPIVVSTPHPVETPPALATGVPLRVYVSGAVRTPAVYELPPGSIVDDAISIAGGPAPDAALESINLALELRDQQHVHVPREGEAPTPPSVSGDGTIGIFQAGDRVNINIATAAQLETLPRIGPALAERIVAYREANGPFSRVEEIQNVDGIGPSTFEELGDRITVGPE